MYINVHKCTPLILSLSSLHVWILSAEKETTNILLSALLDYSSTWRQAIFEEKIVSFSHFCTLSTPHTYCKQWIYLLPMTLISGYLLPCSMFSLCYTLCLERVRLWKGYDFLISCSLPFSPFTFILCVFKRSMKYMEAVKSLWKCLSSPLISSSRHEDDNDNEMVIKMVLIFLHQGLPHSRIPLQITHHLSISPSTNQ